MDISRHARTEERPTRRRGPPRQTPARVHRHQRRRAATAEQPVEVHLAEFPRVWRPGKSMRRVLAACWGADASQWTGRRVELFCDSAVMFGGEAVGGTRISRLSHIDGPKSVPIIVKKGRSGGYKVEPLPDAPAPQQPPEPSAEQVAACVDIDALRTMHRVSGPERRAQIEARVRRPQGRADRGGRMSTPVPRWLVAADRRIA